MSTTLCHSYAFLETDAMFLDFTNDLDNLTGGSSSVGDNSFNGRISMTIATGMDKPISLYVVRFSQTIGMCVRKTFPVRCLKWTNVGREYIEVVKGDLQWFFVLDFNDQAMNRFVEHQMFNTSKSFRATITDTLKSTATPRRLVPTHKTYKNRQYNRFHVEAITDDRIRLLDRSNLTIIAVGQSYFYNDSMSSLRKEGSQSTVWSCSDKHTFEMGCSCPRLGGYALLGRQPSYIKGLGWGPKSKACKTTSVSSSTTSCPQSIVEF
ncbi:CACTA en-spm transposon protein [Cucumis melo var. makuwa]|nr:CACTA en-spm transposon protein [Cucumis melo var. makuwa]